MVQSDDTVFTVGALARALGITPRTVRFYEDKGLISPARVGTYRVYSKRDRARMQLILRGKHLGFSLREIRDYLDLYRADVTGHAQLGLLRRAVAERAAKLQAQRAALDETLAELAEIDRQVGAALATARAPPPQSRLIALNDTL